MKLLVVGSGGREHAIAKKLLESKDVEQVFVKPLRLKIIRLLIVYI